MRSGTFNKSELILVDIVNILPMLMTHLRNPEGFSYVTGVDRLFLAPELNLCNVGPYNDVWSVGVILYLLITGGRNGKRLREKLDFKEDVWFAVSEDLKLFIMDMLIVKPSRREPVNVLLKHPFLESARND